MAEGELSRLAPAATKTVAAGGEEIEVAPMTVGQLPAFARAIRGVPLNLEGEIDVVALVGDHGDQIAEAVAIAVGRPTAWISGLALDEFAQLAAAVLEVNADFFAQRVLPGMTVALTRLTSTLGSISSPA